jgi:hypothetical protein
MRTHGPMHGKHDHIARLEWLQTDGASIRKGKGKASVIDSVLVSVFPIHGHFFFQLVLGIYLTTGE